MKKILALVLASQLLTGCMNMPAKPGALLPVLTVRNDVNVLLDSLLPPTFNGPVDGQFFAPMAVTINAENLRKVDGDWTYTYLRVSGGAPVPNVLTLGVKGIVLGTTTPALAPLMAPATTTVRTPATIETRTTTTVLPGGKP